ncbi:MAG: peptidoglycan bridge formation glycyltransferase FemA/FemB family protein [Bacilli bacterium]|nr:peptidoglycan bridge formation glycyltransferase FemA/FemB family protein [Bacilli bacterium]
MEFTTLTEKEFRDFTKDYEQTSFMQSIELANLKRELGSIPHLVGVKKNKKVIAATLILEEKSILGQKTFYAPRGYLIDYHDFDLLKYFSDELIKYVKKHKGFRITIDPNVVYRFRSSEGEILNEDKDKDDLTMENLKKLGYKYFGFNLYTETYQVRWEYRLKLDEDYETKKQKFSKSTRKNIDASYKKGLKVRVGKIEDLDSMTEIFDVTSKRKDFQSRSLEYYKKMYKHMKDLMTIYIAYLDPDVYLKDTEELLHEAEKEKEVIEEKMKTSIVGSKLTNQKESNLKQIEKYKEELEVAKKFKKENPNGKDIGALLSLRSGKEYLTLSSGMLKEYGRFTPKYAMYDAHIKDAYKEGFEWVDFYGITGDFNKDSKYYGMYEIKKGFNGNVVELIGQFEIKTGFVYNIYNLGKKVKNIIKRK